MPVTPGPFGNFNQHTQHQKANVCMHCNSQLVMALQDTISSCNLYVGVTLPLLYLCLPGRNIIVQIHSAGQPTHFDDILDQVRHSSPQTMINHSQ